GQRDRRTLVSSESERRGYIVRVTIPRGRGPLDQIVACSDTPRRPPAARGSPGRGKALIQAPASGIAPGAPRTVADGADTGSPTMGGRMTGTAGPSTAPASGPIAEPR